MHSLGLQSGGLGLLRGFAPHKLSRPSIMDVFLFLHLVPMIAAVGLRPASPSRRAEVPRRRAGFSPPSGLVGISLCIRRVPVAVHLVKCGGVRPQLRPLYLVESGVLVVALGIASHGASTAWKKVYLNLMAASALYALESQAVNLGLANGSYYTEVSMTFR